MEFLQPYAVWATWALVPVLLLYLLKIRPKSVPVATLLFWQEAVANRALRTLWHRLRRTLSLLVSLLFVSLLILSLLDPVWKRDHCDYLVFLLDTSPGMAAVDSGRTRLEKAKQIISKAVSRLPHGQKVLLVNTSGPKLLVSQTDHPELIKRTIQNIAISYEPQRWENAVALALAGIPENQSVRLVILTDRPQNDSFPVPDKIPVHWIRLGQSENNVALLNLAVRRLPRDPEAFETLVELANFSTEPATLNLLTSLDNVPIDRREISMTPGEIQTVNIRGRAESGGTMTTEIDLPDALSLDNQATVSLPELSTTPLLRFGKDDYFLDHLLATIPFMKPEKITAIPERIPSGSCLLLSGSVPHVLPPGNTILVAPETASDLFEMGDPLEFPLAVDVDRDSPLLDNVQLKNLNFSGARRIIPKNTNNENTLTGPESSKPVNLQVLASTAEGDPLLLFLQESDRQLLIVNANLSQGDLALRTAFPILIDNALRSLTGDKNIFAGTVTTTLPGPVESNLLATTATDSPGPHNRDSAAGPEKFPAPYSLLFPLLFAALLVCLIDAHAWQRRWLD